MVHKNEGNNEVGKLALEDGDLEKAVRQ